MLEARELHVHYGKTHAIKGIDLTVKQGEVVAVLGANGAGKSTLLKALIGDVRPDSGQISFNGIDITTSRIDERIRQGMVLVPEGRQVLVSLTVDENLRLGAYLRADKSGLEDEIDAIYERFSNLKNRRHMLAACLSGGEQQMLAIGRALIAQPSLIMLDEPSLGLSPLLVSQVFQLVAELNQNGLSVLVIEQNTNMALSIAHRAYLLELGSVVLTDTPDNMRCSKRLQAAYVGT